MSKTYRYAIAIGTVVQMLFLFTNPSASADLNYSPQFATCYGKPGAAMIEKNYVVNVPVTEAKEVEYTVHLPNGQAETRTRVVNSTVMRIETRTHRMILKDYSVELVSGKAVEKQQFESLLAIRKQGLPVLVIEGKAQLAEVVKRLVKDDSHVVRLPVSLPAKKRPPPIVPVPGPATR